MPSPTYFRFQADICLRLSLIASDEEVASRLLAMSRGYTAKADALEASRHLSRPKRWLLRFPAAKRIHSKRSNWLFPRTEQCAWRAFPRGTPLWTSPELPARSLSLF